MRNSLPAIFSGLSENSSSTFPSSGNRASGMLREKSESWTVNLAFCAYFHVSFTPDRIPGLVQVDGEQTG